LRIADDVAERNSAVFGILKDSSFFPDRFPPPSVSDKRKEKKKGKEKVALATSRSEKPKEEIEN